MSNPLKILTFDNTPWIRIRYSGVINERPAKIDDLCAYLVGDVYVSNSYGEFNVIFDDTYFEDKQDWIKENPGYQACLDAYKIRQKVEKIVAFCDCAPNTFSESQMTEWLTVLGNAVSDTITIPWSDNTVTLDSSWFVQDLDCQDDPKTGISRVTGTWRKDGDWLPVRVDGYVPATTTTT